jgi:hypothetical protein
MNAEAGPEKPGWKGGALAGLARFYPAPRNPQELSDFSFLAGHSVFFADKCLQELRMEVVRVARLVRRTEADAWVVCAGSREVLVRISVGRPAQSRRQ